MTHSLKGTLPSSVEATAMGLFLIVGSIPRYLLRDSMWHTCRGSFPLSAPCCASSGSAPLKRAVPPIENSTTGKVTAVVAILQVFGDTLNNSRNANPGKTLSKPNTRLNSKKKGLHRSFKHHGGFREHSSNASDRLIVKQKLSGCCSTQD